MKKAETSKLTTGTDVYPKRRLIYYIIYTL